MYNLEQKQEWKIPTIAMIWVEYLNPHIKVTG